VAYALMRDDVPLEDFSVWLLFFPIFLGGGYVWGICAWRLCQGNVPNADRIDARK
jgi:hypothetical protein